jgi:ribosomal protein S10
VELQQAESLTEQLRSEHGAWMRQAHKRQEELEEANSELTRTLMSKEREVGKERPLN